MSGRTVVSAAAVVIALGVMWVLKAQLDGIGGNAARIDAHLTELNRTLDALEKITARAETTYIRDTIRITNERQTTNTILEHTTDTLIHRDTVVQIVERERRACDSALSSCNLRVQAITDERDNALEQRDTLLALQPSVWDKARTAGTWATVGAVLALVFAR